MNISNQYNLYTNYIQNSKIYPPSYEQVVEKRSQHMDRVTISNEARALMEEENLPIEAYALPKWMADFLPKETILSNVRPNNKAIEYFEALRMDSSLSNEERREMRKEYLENDLEHQKWLQRDASIQKNSDKIDSYNFKIIRYLNEAREENGIMNAKDNYEKTVMIKNENLDMKIHQSFLERINNDPALLELMKQLEIKNS